jgi:hypothetical protein
MAVTFVFQAIHRHSIHNKINKANLAEFCEGNLNFLLRICGKRLSGSVSGNLVDERWNGDNNISVVSRHGCPNLDEGDDEFLHGW